MDIIKRSFSISFRIMKLLRLYSTEKYARFFKVQAYTMYLLFIIFIPILTLICLVVDDDLDASQINDNASYLAQSLGFTAKILPFIRDSRRIKKCIHFFEDPCFEVHTDGEKKIIDKCVRICRRNTMIYFVTLSLGIVIWILKPLFLQGYRFPVDIWLPFDPTTEPTTYYSVYLLLAAGMLYIGLAAMIDPLLGGLVCQVVGQLQVLKYNLQHLGGEPENPDVYDKVIQCIEHHKSILTFVKQYEECFSFAIFSQFATGVVTICFCCLQLSKAQELGIETVSSSLSGLIVILAQIYFYCYYGTLIFEENYSLTQAICMGEWYQYDIKSKKALIVLMERSKKPLKITAGKVLDLSLETFTLIVRRSYSLLAVLGNYNNTSKVNN